MTQLPEDFLRERLPLPHGPEGPGLACVIVRGGSVVAQHCAGMACVEHQVPITPQTVFRVASITKQFLCAGLLALADEGKLDLDAPLGEFVTLQPGPAQATLRQAMSNTSGIRDHLELWYIAGGGLQMPHRLEESVALCGRQTETNFPPGTRYLYSNANFLLLSQVAEMVSGQPLADYLNDRFFAPLGMTRTRLRSGHFDVVPQLATGYVAGADGALTRGRLAAELWGEGAAHSCLEDLVTWIGYYRTDPDGIISRMRKPMPVGDGAAPYGLGLFTEIWGGAPSIVHTGIWPGYLSELVYFLEEDLAIATLYNVNSGEPTQVNRALARQLLPDRVQQESVDCDEAAWDAAVEAGLWIAPDTLDVAEFSTDKDNHKVFLSHGLSFRLHAAPHGRLVPEFRRSDYAALAIEQAATGRIQLELVNGAAVTLVPAHTLGNGIGSDRFAGVWWSDEIGARLVIRRKDGVFNVSAPDHGGHQWVTTVLPGEILQIEDVAGPWHCKFFLLLQDEGETLIFNGPRVRHLRYVRQT